MLNHVYVFRARMLNDLTSGVFRRRTLAFRSPSFTFKPPSFAFKPPSFTFGLPSFTRIALLVFVMGLCPQHSPAQLALGKGRFVGNALSSGIPIYTNYSKYWNQVTPGNAGKWGSVEGLMGSYDWTSLDAIFNYSTGQGYPYKHHCLIWGSQQPAWIGGLDSAQQRAKVEKWIDTVGARYGAIAMIDVVNEPFHAPPPYMHALGDSGKTGWDWVVTAFTMARQHTIRGTKLLINEYNVLQDNAVTTRYLALIDTLRVRGLIDAIGVQGHYFEFRSFVGAPNSYVYSVATLKSNLDRLAATGLPVYITEFDINEAADTDQLTNYKTYFPLFWETPGVKGITLWGYVQGDMWKENAYLVRSNGTERPALQWMRKYIASPLPPALVSPVGTTGEPRNPRLLWHASASALSYRVEVSATGRFTSTVVDTTVTDTLSQLAPLAANTGYFWRVTAVNDSGPSTPSSVGSFATGDQITGVENPVEVAQEFGLYQNYPNPFNPSTTIRYSVSGRGTAKSGTEGTEALGANNEGSGVLGLGSSWVKLGVYDILGREVAVLVNEPQPPGEYRVNFNATNLPSGAYFYKLNAGDFTAVKKLVILK
jgi:endo-1,4-beta-xylanase